MASDLYPRKDRPLVIHLEPEFWQSSVQISAHKSLGRRPTVLSATALFLGNPAGSGGTVVSSQRITGGKSAYFVRSRPQNIAREILLYSLLH